MYEIGKKYGNLNRKIYIDSNFTESSFLKCTNPYKILQDLSDVYFRPIFGTIS